MLGNILIYLSLPCVILNSFLIERSSEKLIGLLLSSILSLLILILSICISRLFFRTNAIETFSAAFSNPGFFGIPLIIAGFSSDSVFYIAPFIAFLNLLQWTYGVSLMTENDESPALSIRIHSILCSLRKAPFMIAILTGLFFFLTGIPLPTLLQQCISSIADMNTPAAMFTIGIYLAQTNAARLFLTPRLYLVSLVRMVLIPLASALLLLPVPNAWIDLKFTLLIAASCPVGSNVAVYAQLHNSDYTYAVENVVLSTLFSILTLPAILQFADYIWNQI